MVQAIKEEVVVQPGGLIEIRRSDLPVGARAEVIVMIDQQVEGLPPMSSYVGKGKGCFANAAEVDAFLRAERDAWEN
jgi:hypothetical protein